jgi:hypothetical protein
MGRSSCGTATLVLATCFGPIAIALLAVSFASDYWIEYTVNRSILANDLKTDARQMIICIHHGYNNTAQIGPFNRI